MSAGHLGKGFHLVVGLDVIHHGHRRIRVVAVPRVNPLTQRFPGADGINGDVGSQLDLLQYLVQRDLLKVSRPLCPTAPPSLKPPPATPKGRSPDQTSHSPTSWPQSGSRGPSAHPDPDQTQASQTDPSTNHRLALETDDGRARHQREEGRPR